ncbi:hypothetical protein FXO38_24187 [Capsicum annuum]|uniref:BTB domain-containing protein n=1 Tax=Capsicum annuum TaxID=4072 RepID=A0A2G3A6D9_CAPAN|nr:hypothetical protein FXO38_24187 [Capsicum annuum]PHT89788.1 hypothetical protein T459_04901 [Capsicum annuum]
MLSEELRFHRLNLDNFKTPYIQHCILEMLISDVSIDLTIEVGSASFALHKKAVARGEGYKGFKNQSYWSSGGSDAFELTEKFCYGVNIEITISNVALLRCAARFMEMTEDISEKNL